MWIFYIRKVQFFSHGLQLPAIYDLADTDIFIKDGQFAFGSQRRSGGKSGADFSESDIAVVTSRRDQWYYARISSGSQFVLYPETFGRRTVFPYWNMIENQFITVGEWNFGSAISMIMAVIMMLLMMAVEKWNFVIRAERRNSHAEQREKTVWENTYDSDDHFLLSSYCIYDHLFV